MLVALISPTAAKPSPPFALLAVAAVVIVVPAAAGTPVRSMRCKYKFPFAEPKVNIEPMFACVRIGLEKVTATPSPSRSR
jgi:hypothetical protein